MLHFFEKKSNTPAMVPPEEPPPSPENRFRDLIQGLDAIVWEADLETHRFSFVSQRAESILGYPLSQWLFEPGFWAAHLHPEDRERTITFRRDALAAGRNHNYEYRLISANGRAVWFRDRVRLVLDESGKAHRIRGVMVDTSERRQAEDALRESIRRFREMLENIRMMAVGLDLKGNITLCNDFLLGQTGWKREEIIGQNWFDLFIPEDVRSQVRNAFFEGITQGKILSHSENDIVTKTGQRRSISWNNGVLRDLQGQMIGTTNIGEDITERKNLEEQLRQAQKMEAIGRLTGGVAHDFNNLLTAIIGYGELMVMKLGPDHALFKHAEEICNSAERAATLTRQLLTFSRKQVLAPRVLEINNIIGTVDRILRRLIGEDIKFKTSLDPRLGRVRADSSQIEQVILNLALNARDAMPKGGLLTLRTENVEIDHSYAQKHWKVRPGRYVMLSVSDTGIGMNEETRSHLFEPFFTTKEVGKGTGLGLSTVYGILQQSGGHIDVITAPGKGSTFKIYLPRVEDSHETPISHSVPSPMPSGGSETILIVEDEDHVRQLLSEILTAEGYKILTARHGMEALKVSASHSDPIHLMVTDVVMPELGGRELAQKMATHRPKTKVLFISGYAGTELMNESFPESEKNFLQKPFSPEVFRRKIRQILDDSLS